MTDNIIDQQLDWARKQLQAALMSSYAGKVTFHFKQQRVLQTVIEPTHLANDVQEAKSLIEQFNKTATSNEIISFSKRPDGRYGGSRKKVLKPMNED